MAPRSRQRRTPLPRENRPKVNAVEVFTKALLGANPVRDPMVREFLASNVKKNPKVIALAVALMRKDPGLPAIEAWRRATVQLFGKPAKEKK